MIGWFRPGWFSRLPGEQTQEEKITKDCGLAKKQINKQKK